MSLRRLPHPFRELRKSPRYEVHYPAHIDVDGKSPPVSCIVSDISTSGAKLTVGARGSVPDEITLIFRRRCRVIRRSDGQIGVEFI
jgi:hypothetical protein